ncbi:MAG: hypothetical protein OXI87_24785 [Albidovulum sp.]|nr:hypothetical protein [Albidovulum sp.]
MTDKHKVIIAAAVLVFALYLITDFSRERGGWVFGYSFDIEWTTPKLW